MRHRTFVDSSKVMWTVLEVCRATSRPAGLPADLAGGWLAFQSHGERRRLAPAPVGWEAMTDAQLELLSLAALPTAHWQRRRGA